MGGPATGGSSGELPKIIRGNTARAIMKLAWEYPVYVEPVVEDTGPTRAAKVRRALSREDALAYIAGTDPRPLLVLRECKTCNGTDDALLSRGNIDNERTFLLARWFHCVKLPVDVMQKDHPFHNLFNDADPEHMFMGTLDGTLHVPLESERSRVELWDTMAVVLKASYAKDPEGQVKQMQHTIDALDLLDQRIGMLEKKIDQILETDGADSKKLPKAKTELDEAKAEREQLTKSLDLATAELKLKKPVLQPAGPAPKGS